MARLDSKNILIVDDDEDILGSIELVMRAEGAATASVTDGNAAVSLVQSMQPDAVVLDMMLPKRSGFLVLEKIVQVEDPPIVVMITANQGKRHMAYAKALGVDAYLIKPVSLERLVDTVVDLLEKRALGPAENGERSDGFRQCGVRPLAGQAFAVIIEVAVQEAVVGNQQLVILSRVESTGDGLAPLGDRSDIVRKLSVRNTSPERADRADLLYGPGIRIELPPGEPVTQMLVTIIEEEIAWQVVMRLARELEWKLLDPTTGRELCP